MTKNLPEPIKWHHAARLLEDRRLSCLIQQQAAEARGDESMAALWRAHVERLERDRDREQAKEDRNISGRAAASRRRYY